MGRRSLLIAFLLCLWPSTAAAAPVLELGPGGVHAREDPFLQSEPRTPRLDESNPALLAPRAAGRGAAGVSDALARLLRRRAITRRAYGRYLSSLRAATGTASRLSGTRAGELNAVLRNLEEIALSGELTPSRLPALFLTLNRNRQWWSRGALLSPGERVEFAGSQIVWEYYRGQGIELQVLGSFGKADGMWTAGPQHYKQFEQLLGELIPLAAWRAGHLTWEYYFHFDGGNPPWTSAMSQGTAIEALTRGYSATSDPSFLATAHRALGIFQVAPPLGVAERTRAGTRYLQYSFAGHTFILNAFLQALIGLYDYQRVSGDRLARRLFVAGDAEARREVPSYDTGRWSLYEPGVPDSVDYHVLVTGFLQELCARTQARVYCSTARRFAAYLKHPPRVR